MTSLLSASRVAQAFSRASERYDKVAGLQRQVANHLILRCGPQLSGQVVDLGCGTGYVTRKLLQHQQVSKLFWDRYSSGYG